MSHLLFWGFMVCYLADVLFQNIMVIYLPCKIIETLNLENVYKASSSVVRTMRVSSIVFSILPKIWQLISSKAGTSFMYCSCQSQTLTFMSHCLVLG